MPNKEDTTVKKTGMILDVFTKSLLQIRRFQYLPIGSNVFDQAEIPEAADLRTGPMYSSTMSPLKGTGMFFSFISSWGFLAASRALLMCSSPKPRDFIQRGGKADTSGQIVHALRHGDGQLSALQAGEIFVVMNPYFS